MKNLLKRAGYLLLSLFLLLCVFLLQAVCIMLFNPLTEIWAEWGPAPDTDSAYAWFMVFYGVLATFIAGIWYCLLDRRGFRPRRGRRHAFLLTAGSYIVLSVALQHVAQYISLFTGFINPLWYMEYTSIVESAGLNDLILPMILYVIFLAPLCEELIFRGILLFYARKAFPWFWAANVLQAFLFGVFHLNVIQGVYAFVLGIVIGWLYQERGRLSYCVIFHMLFNFMGCFCNIVQYTGSSRVLHLLWFGAACLASGTGMVMFHQATDNHNEKDIEI